MWEKFKEYKGIMIILIITIRMSLTVSEWSFSKSSQSIRFGDKIIDMLYFESDPEAPWFKGKPLAEALEYADTKQAISVNVPAKWRNTCRRLIEIYGSVKIWGDCNIIEPSDK